MIDTARLDTLKSVTLHAGNNGMDAPCIMDVVDYITGGSGNNDKPSCASSVIAQFAITINDVSVFAAFRQELLPFAVRIAGTAGTPEQEQTRAFILVDWSVREIAPLAFKARGLSEQADVLRHLAPITNRETARAAARATVAAYTYIAAYAAAYAAADAYAAYAAADAAYAAAYTADAYAAAAYAADSAYAAAVAKDPRIVWDMCLEVLNKLIKVTE